MKIINHSSDQIRQIVPADMSFLSDADQQVTQALHHILAAMLGGNGTETIVLSGCEITSNAPQGGSPSVDFITQSYNYHITDGVLLHKGRIYELAAADWEEGNTDYVTYVGGAPRPTAIIVFGDKDTSPSPVYGGSLNTDQYPHRQLTASIQPTMVTRSQQQAGSMSMDYTYTYNPDAADYVPFTRLKHLPVLGNLE